MRARARGASEPRERSGARGPRERACRGGRRGEAPRQRNDCRAAERDASGGGAPRAINNAGARLRRGIARTCTIAVGIVLGSASRALACPMCFGAEETAMIDGTKLGILMLLALTLAVQGGFVGFFLYLRRRAKRNAEAELETEWSELQRASRTS